MSVARSSVASSKEKVRNEDEWSDNVRSGVHARTHARALGVCSRQTSIISETVTGQHSSDVDDRYTTCRSTLYTVSLPYISDNSTSRNTHAVLVFFGRGFMLKYFLKEFQNVPVFYFNTEPRLK